MTTLLEYFVLIAPYAETEETPPPGRSPEAPKGDDDYDDDDDKDTEDDDWDDETPEPGVFQFPEKKDPMM